MTPLRPAAHPDGRYNTVETAALLGINRTTLWRVTNAGKLRPGFDRHTGQARYRGRDIIAYWETKSGGR